MFRRTRFARTRTGEYKLRLEPDERAMIAGLPDQLESLLRTEGPDAGRAMVRLFPPAYVDDRERDAEYHRLMREELVGRRLEALELVRDTVESDSLTDEQLHTWSRVLNDVRLVLGTLLDVSEETDVLDADPQGADAPQRVLYYILSGIVDDAVCALSTNLPPPTVAD